MEWLSWFWWAAVHWAVEFQTALAGVLAVFAALVGAQALHRTSTNQTAAQDRLASLAAIDEREALAEGLSAELICCQNELQRRKTELPKLISSYPEIRKKVRPLDADGNFINPPAIWEFIKLVIEPLPNKFYVGSIFKLGTLGSVYVRNVIAAYSAMEPLQPETFLKTMIVDQDDLRSLFPDRVEGALMMIQLALDTLQEVANKARFERGRFGVLPP